MFYRKLSVCDDKNIESAKLKNQLFFPENEPVLFEIFG